MTAGRGVPVGRRLLFTDRRRAALTVGGVAAALLLVLTLDAVFAGAVQRVTAYLRSSPADVVVSQAGVRTMHMSASTLPDDVAAQAARVDGVGWVDPIGFVSGAVLRTGGGQQLAYLVGYDPATGRGGPTQIVTGRAPAAVGEAVLDRLAADQLGVTVGQTVHVSGAPLRVTGLTTGLTSITNTTVFVPRAQFATLGRPTTSYLLVGAAAGAQPADVARRLTRAIPGTTAQTREQFVASEARIVTDMSADLLRLMALIGLLIALAVVALGLLTATLTRLREYAVLKALGATTPRLAASIAAQVTSVVGLAAVAAAVGALLLASALPAVAPTVQLVVTPGSAVRVSVEALAAGLVAALLPLYRLARVDAASAFREAR